MVFTLAHFPNRKLVNIKSAIDTHCAKHVCRDILNIRAINLPGGRSCKVPPPAYALESRKALDIGNKSGRLINNSLAQVPLTVVPAPRGKETPP